MVLNDVISFELFSLLIILVGYVQEEGVLRGQELENAVLDADYNKAIQIAFELRRPNKLFELFSELCRLEMILHQ